MVNVLIVAQENDTAKRLQSGLESKGFKCSMASAREKVTEQVAKRAPDLVVVEMNGLASQALVQELSRSMGRKKHTPIIALANEDMLAKSDVYPGVDDFVLKPYDARELALRARRLLKNGNGGSEVIRCGSLTVDLAKCEVTVGGKLVELTFKEYELLKFLVQDRGRVFTREVLLNHVWGYDYYGGDRTVDVHVRRLRSKPEASGHTFIETVRNIGYRVEKDTSSH